MPNELAVLSDVRKRIATAKDLPSLKAIRDDAMTAVQHAKRLRIASLEGSNDCYEMVLVCEREMGCILANSERNKGSRVSGSNVQPPDDTPTLGEMGIDKWQSKRWQAEASVSEEDFQSWMAELRVAGGEFSAVGLRTLATEGVRGSRQAESDASLRKKAVSQVKEALSQLTKALDVLELCEDEWSDTIKAIYRAVEED